jgi:hypothetical protein
MNISDDTTKLLLDINDFSDDFIKHNYEISILVEAAFTAGDKDEFEKVIFTGKYLNGLKTIMSRNVSSDKSARERIENEFKVNTGKLIKYLKDIVENTDEETKKYFRENYFSLTGNSLDNVLSLAGDLSLIKKYFNVKKSA